MLTASLVFPLLLLQSVAPAADSSAGTSGGSVAAAQPAKAEKITDRNHPDYLRCRREPVIGSRAKKRKICMTNREWEKVARAGNRGARTIVADAQPGFMSAGN